MKNIVGYVIEKGTFSDLDELEVLYNDLNDFLVANINYPGWIKGIYPIRATAEAAVVDGSLFVFRLDGKIVGSIVLNHLPCSAYDEVVWSVDVSYDEVIVIHTLVVHPDFFGMGIGGLLLDFAKQYSLENDMKSIRLDVSVDNTLAIGLYEKHSFKYIGTVDLELGYAHLIWFKLYEFVL